MALYRNDLKNREDAKEAPRFLSKLAGAEAAKLKKFSDTGGTKSGGCPTLAETDSSSCFGIDAGLDIVAPLLFGDHGEARSEIYLLKKRPRREPWKFSSLRSVCEKL